MWPQSPTRLWCHIEDRASAFSVTVPITRYIDELKALVWEKGINAKLKPEILAQDLTLWKVRVR